MAKGILGRKVGMTQLFADNGELIPVTVIQAEGNVVLQKKTEENDGYNAIQLGFTDKKESRSNKAEKGHAEKASTNPKRFVREIRNVNLDEYEVGQDLSVDVFEAGEKVNVTGTSKGKGFQGSIKRHNQSRGPMTHGSHYHRGPGAMGVIDPMRVFKGKKLPGQMGKETVTIQNLEIVKVDAENNLILVKGNVPGPKKSYVQITGADQA
ncbi:50S ribosomal protein L3 [Allobacillus sp. GCM10007491]|uniref:Large ribosomal subunit protein uL3 n=1 Tax=Allobacillus saliphilus TaxID=2912308 RepID=A0A941HU09_9BACI|nr:50S ribosomal protein L3 [Allobacillus saliphilus]MBR7553839.1 50S ribosomal protein L3 [Allobacillus saliphilus]